MGLFDGKKFDLQSAVGKIQGKIADIAQTTESANVKTDSAPNDNLGKIMFCSNCGTKLNSDAKFCHGCGTAIQGKQEAQVIPSVQMPSVPPIPPQSNNSERQQEYVEQNEPNKIESSNARQNDFVGNVKKCPACGAELSSFTAICPTCGHEINSVSGSNSIKDFSERIDEYDRQISASSIKSKGGWSAWSTNLRIGWVVLNIYTFCIPLLVRAIINLIRFFMPKLSPQEKIKTAFIENYHFPNEKEAIAEALLFIKTKMLFMESDTDKYSLHWSRVWSNKAAQLYQKADIMFHGDKISEEAYFTIKQCQTKIKKKRILVPIITIASIFLVISILCVSCGIRHSNEDFPNTKNATNSIVSEETLEQFVTSYEKAEFVKYNSPASENGLGNSKIYFLCTLDKTEIFETNESYSIILGYATDESGNQWLIELHIIPIVSKTTFDSYIGKNIVLRGVYDGFSETKEMPVVILDEMIALDTGEEVFGMQKVLDE